MSDRPEWTNDHRPLLEALGIPNMDKARRVQITFEPNTPLIVAVDYQLDGHDWEAADIARRHYRIEAKP